MPAHRLERLAHLERVTDRCTERLVHVGEETDDTPARLFAQRPHQLGEPAGVLE